MDKQANVGFSMDVDEPEHSVATWGGFGDHGMRASTSHDEGAQINFMMSMYRHLGQHIAPGRRAVYDARVKPKFVREHNREPKDRHEVRKATLDDSYFQMWGHLRVYCQQKGNDIKRELVNRQLGELVERAKPKQGDRGTIELNPGLKIPSYQSSFDMHWMPGSYFTERTEDDVAAGALYDTGGLYVSTSGHLGAYNDGAAYAVVAHLREKYPDFVPHSILDEGCTVGHNTLPFKDAWPDAEVVGIDIGAPVLRYAHRRAEELGYEIRFSQQNAEKTKYEDESFDFIVSTMFLHETSKRAIRNIVAEARRLLKPGGLMLHVEQPPFRWFDDPFEQFVRDWDTHNNNEPFWGPMHDMDLEDVAVKAGFAREDVIQEMTKLITPTATDKYNVGKGAWYVFGAWKR